MMHGWPYLLGGLLVWAVHFFGLYVAASLFLTSPATRLVTAILTFICLAAAAALLWRGWTAEAGQGETFAGWQHRLAAYGAAIALVAIVWQGLPALLV